MTTIWSQVPIPTFSSKGPNCRTIPFRSPDVGVVDDEDDNVAVIDVVVTGAVDVDVVVVARDRFECRCGTGGRRRLGPKCPSSCSLEECLLF